MDYTSLSYDTRKYFAKTFFDVGNNGQELSFGSLGTLLAVASKLGLNRALRCHGNSTIKLLYCQL